MFSLLAIVCMCSFYVLFCFTLDAIWSNAAAFCVLCHTSTCDSTKCLYNRYVRVGRCYISIVHVRFCMILFMHCVRFCSLFLTLSLNTCKPKLNWQQNTSVPVVLAALAFIYNRNAISITWKVPLCATFVFGRSITKDGNMQ